ncbi:nucleotide triphosphate diphosphatase NUDT15 [Xenorhabdus thuongxuanensis]|uniref:ADP-ribose pyrophosphatase n=1 Tax=Xenorhabdus thuongxuanensis TaxID=1873484 RepID=A0A1Q5U7N1_9GAMM|nr:NUDIX domain-containing protein [Xenorhabdus thuongxuanensis]OKP08482.1 ADP-ribose pyrophosphatase [Xenorhabdus thuongxuanensis]
MSKNGKPVIGVGTIVIRPDGAVLLGYRIKPGEVPCWCLPGGHVESGESFEAAAVREVAEEAGITDLNDVRILAITQQLDSPVSTITGAVLASISTDVEALVLEPEVFSSWHWFSPDVIPVPLYPASNAVLACWLGTDSPDNWRIYFVNQTGERM